MLQKPRSLARAIGASLATALVLAVLAAFATAVLMRSAPGFFSDERELDARYGETVRQELQQTEQQQSGMFQTCLGIGGHWMHLDFGRSRTWDVPVSSMIASRTGASVWLLAISLPLSWLLAFAAALPFSAATCTSYEMLAVTFVSLALAIPAGAFATICIVAGHGGPILVLTILLAGRLYRFLHPMLQQAWSANHVTNARGMGIGDVRLLRRYVFPQIWPQLVPLLGMSMMTALGALVPVEVLFDQPGLGKLAWQSSINRDLPVLMAVTLLFAGAIAFAGAISNETGLPESDRA